MTEGPEHPVVTRTEEDERLSARYIEGPESVTVARFEMHGAWRWEAHHHDDAHQLLWSPAGAVTVQTEELDWLVPSTVGLWIPAGVVHSVDTAQPARLYSLYFESRRCPHHWPAPTPVAVGPLTRELIIHLDNPELSGAERHRAEAVLYDCLAPLARATLHIPMPADSRARRVAEAILADPADQRDLAAWGREVGAGVRTLTRIFAAETHMAFTQWRLHVRMRAAMQLLAAGASVDAAAKRVGYRTSSAFVQAFHRVTGTTPAAYAAGRQPSPPVPAPGGST